MKRVVSLCVVAIMLCCVSAVLIGCGKDPDEGKVVIFVADKIDNPTGIDAWRAQRQKDFDEAYPEISVKHINEPSLSGSENQKIMTIFTSDEQSPAVAQVANINANRSLYKTGLLGNWAPFLKDWEGYENFTDVMKESYASGDAIIGFPISQEVPLLGFNRAMLTEYLESQGETLDGFKLETWDEYREIAKALTTDTVSGSSMFLSDYYLFFGNWVLANGDKIASESETGKITLNFDNDNLVDTIEFIREMRFTDGSITHDMSDTDLASFMSKIWTNKIASYTFYPTWATWWTNASYDIKSVYLTPFPAGPSEEYGTAFYPTSYVLNSHKTAEQQEAAATYVKFMCSEEAWLSRIDFANKRKILQVVFPPYKTMDYSELVKNLPEDWSDATMKAMETGKVPAVAVDNHITYLFQKMPSLLTTANLSRDDIKQELRAAQSTAESSWLIEYNKDR